MNKNLLAGKIEKNLKAQIDIAEQIYVLQKTMYKAVLKRDWQESEKQINMLSILSARFAELDKKNYLLFGNTEDGMEKFDFVNAVKDFSQEDKNRLNLIYNELKEKVYRSKIENDAFSSYLEHAQSLVQGMVDIILDERNGKCYTQTGQRVNVDMTSLVLNEIL